MKKHIFDETDGVVVPDDVMDAIGKRLDADLKKAMHEAIDDMELQSYSELWRASNSQLLEWMKDLLLVAPIYLTERPSGVIVRCQLLSSEDVGDPGDFSLEVPISDLAKDVLEWDDPERNKRIAASLRSLAKSIDGRAS